MPGPFKAFLLVAALLLAGCGGEARENADDGAVGNDAQDLSPEGPSMTARLFGGGKPMPLTIQNAHQSGLVLQLTSVQAKATETIIGVTVINGDTDEQWLNRFPNSRNGYLLASNGERLYLSPPVANPDLSIGAGQRMRGELVFLGRLPESGGATLVLNDGRDLGGTHTSSPGFRIPLQLDSAAFTDDGSKKKSAA